MLHGPLVKCSKMSKTSIQYGQIYSRIYVLNTLLDRDQTVGVRMGLEVPWEALLRLKIQQQTIHIE